MSTIAWQNDGAGFHVPISGQTATFQYNWVHDGYHSMMIRTDTATSTPLRSVGKHGTVRYNVGWGGPALTIKGDYHRIEHNTVTEIVAISFWEEKAVTCL